MARKEVVLITGANGEIGHGLITHFGRQKNVRVIGLDITPLDEALRPYCHEFILGDILDTMLLGRLILQYEIRTIYHLASILSTKAEFNPEAAHRVNVEGTLNLLRLAVEQSSWQGRPVKFLFPSSIAAYGLPDLQTKNKGVPVKEHRWNLPATIYGCNKLYCEHLVYYFATHYRQLAGDKTPHTVDFRCIRFPGIISAFTVPTGGTSDYAAEMIHHAAQQEPYACFVRPDTIMPFMVMPDAIKALVQLEAVPRQQLTRHVYNVTSFKLTAQDIRGLVEQAFPKANIDFVPDENRQGIVDSWPADLNDTPARDDWAWQAEYNLERAFQEYLIPNITKRYTLGLKTA
jgi:nucleoside-diphosphate-sugar epimerase